MKHRWEDGIDSLELSARALNCLQSAGLRTVGEIRFCSEQELLRIPNLGPYTLQEIKAEVGSIGFCKPRLVQDGPAYPVPHNKLHPKEKEVREVMLLMTIRSEAKHWSFEWMIAGDFVIISRPRTAYDSFTQADYSGTLIVNYVDDFLKEWGQQT
jgi:hypothetical protein